MSATMKMMIYMHESEGLRTVHTELKTVLAKNARPMVASRFEQSFVRQCLKDFYRDVLNS